jgi:CheY-like chemotaxis protein
MRGRSDLAKTRVIVLSSGPTPEHRQRAEDLHVAAYLTKPVRQSVLLDSIASAIGPPQLAARPAGAGQRPASDAAPQRPLKILLAEDNPVNQMTATTMLEKLGHAVTVANNGREAVDKVQGEQFDVVFMDVQMPEMDGLAATGQIRALEKQTRKHVPIVAMTAHAMKGDKERCLEAGMDNYVSKPIRRKELSAVIEAIIQQFLAPGEAVDGTNGKEESAMEVFDKDGLLEECDGDLEYISRMLQMFDNDIRERMVRLQKAVDAGDCDAMMREAHAVKGGAGNFFATAAFETAQQLETMGRNKQCQGAQATLQLLQKNLQQLRSALEALVKEPND